MANFAVQLKERFLGLVDRVIGSGRAGGDRDVKEITAKSPAVQEHVEIRSRDPDVQGGSKAGAH